MKSKTKHTIFSLLNFIVMILFLLPVLLLRIYLNMNFVLWLGIVVIFSWIMSHYVPARFYQPFKVPELSREDKIKSVKFDLFLPFVIAGLLPFTKCEVWIYILIAFGVFYFYGRSLKQLKLLGVG